MRPPTRGFAGELLVWDTAGGVPALLERREGSSEWSRYFWGPGGLDVTVSADGRSPSGVTVFSDHLGSVLGPAARVLDAWRMLGGEPAVEEVGLDPKPV